MNHLQKRHPRVFRVRRLRMNVHRHDFVRAVRNRHVDGHIVEIAAVYEAVAVDLAHRKHRKTRGRRDDPVGKRAGLHIAQAHRRGRKLRHANGHDSQIHAAGANRALVEMRVQQRLHRRGIHLQMPGIFNQKGNYVALAGNHAVDREIFVLGAHQLLYIDALPQAGGHFQITLRKQRRVDRAHARSINRLKAHAQLAERLPRADFISAAGAAAAQNQCSSHIVSS